MLYEDILFFIYRGSLMSGTPPTPTPSATTISTLTEGKLTSVVGRITEVDDRPASISTQDGKIIQIFHVVFTDKTGSIQATMWDRTADFRNFRLGDVVEIQNVVAKICGENFQEYGPISINFGRASRIGPLLGSAVQGDIVRFPRTSIRVPRLPSTSPAPSSLATPVKKRAREEGTCPAGCDSPSKPFCSLSGKPHAARCDVCQQLTAGYPFCPETGLQHV